MPEFIVMIMQGISRPLKRAEKQEERWAVHVDGIKIPGFSSEAEVAAEIAKRPEWQGKGAVPVKLLGDVKQDLSK